MFKQLFVFFLIVAMFGSSTQQSVSGQVNKAGSGEGSGQIQASPSGISAGGNGDATGHVDGGAKASIP